MNPSRAAAIGPLVAGVLILALAYLALQTASLSQRMDELDRRLTEQVAEVERQVVILRDGVW